MNEAPLAGVRVVALEQAVSMPYCSFVLAEMGADVIKIERPGSGDVLRGWDDAVRGLSTGYVWINANKRDLTLDLRQPEAQRIMRELLAESDVFLENFTPGVVGRFGLDYSALQDVNPSLVYCSLSGYGQDGPYRDVKAYDLLIQGESGVLLSNGYPDAPAKVGLPVTDLVAGSTAAIGISMALYARERTGRGAYLDVSMLDSILPWLGYFPHRYWHQQVEPPRTGMRHQYLCPYGPYLAEDDVYVNLVVASDDHWRRFCSEVADRPEWLADPILHSIESRSANRSEAEEAIERVIGGHPSTYWFDRLDEAGLPCGQVRRIADVVRHPQVASRGMIVETDSAVGVLPLMRFPLASPDAARSLPELGEHVDEILGELGYDAAEIADMRTRSVV